MIITNKTGLPQPIVEAIKSDEWSRGDADISVSELITPIRIIALRSSEIAGEIEEDAADRIFALMGKIGHGILEASGYDRFTEKQLFTKINGGVLSGRMDGLYLEKLHDDDESSQWGIDDYKFTSAYVAKPRKPGERSRIDDWFLQLNLYRLLAEDNGFSINRLRLIMLLRDWSVLAAKRDRDFPQKQVVVMEVPLMSLDSLRVWVHNTFSKHMQAQQGLDQIGQSELPDCTDEERWARPEKFAVMKKGRQSALRVLDTEPEAMAWIVENSKKGTEKDPLSVTYRPGTNVRCENYCEVAPICDQWKALQIQNDPSSATGDDTGTTG